MRETKLEEPNHVLMKLLIENDYDRKISFETQYIGIFINELQLRLKIFKTQNTQVYKNRGLLILTMHM